MIQDKNLFSDKTIQDFHIPRWQELPALDLYMDQVIAFIEGSLGSFFASVGANRYPGGTFSDEYRTTR